MPRAFAAALAACVGFLSPAAFAADGAAMTLNLLDYIAVDYANAVENGRVKSEDEYREMSEFASQVATLVAALPDNPARVELAAQGELLATQVAKKSDSTQVAATANALREALIRAYRVPVAPRRAPDLALGAKLFAQHCATCHGPQGFGDGIAAKGLQPPPSNFHDRQRMDRRSVFALYNTITLGVQGTAMAPFSALSESERWALAFQVASFASPAAASAKGEALWKNGSGRAEFSELAPVVTLSRSEVQARHGDGGVSVQAFLLAHPEAITQLRPAPIDFAVDKLAASVAAYRQAERERASQLAIQAYLEGFELVEATLSNIDADLMRRTERAMIDYRAAVASGAPSAQVEALAHDAEVLLAESREKLAGGALSPAATFSAALIILLREGLEAVLVLAAIFAFLGKAGRVEARRYVHLGWIAALALGVLTWIASSELIEISGASREVTEGVTALISAGLLLYVGYWLHDKSHAAAWQKFIREQVGGALSRGTVSTLALVSFLAVYREVFETVLFFQALATQSGPEGHAALVSGVAVGFAALAALAFLILRWSARVPLGLFFTLSALLLAALAVIFTGQGIAALQEATWIDVRPLGSIRIPMLGIFPTLQSLGAQAAVAVLIAIGIWWTKRPSR